VDTEKLKSILYSAGWRQEGHPACKTYHRTIKTLFQGKPANLGLPESGR